MNDPILDPYIQAIRKERLPDCPPTMEVKVLRRIRLSRREGPRNLFSFPRTLPGLSASVAAAAAVAVLLGASTALWFTTVEAKRRVEHRMSVRALDFEVFRDQSLQASARRSP